VRFVFILQDGAQLERLYQRTGQKILMGASTIKVFMNFQNLDDATAVSLAAGKTTEWVEQSSYSHRHGRRQRSISKVPVSVDLLPVNTLMMMKPEEAILQVTGMPLMRIMKLDAGGERMFAKVRKFRPVTRPCMEPVEWTIADSDEFKPATLQAPGAAPQTDGTAGLDLADDIDLAAIERVRQPQDLRFIVKEGVRHVYISSLDELRRRLDLDETRATGVAEEDAPDDEQQPGRNPATGAAHWKEKHIEGRRPRLARADDIDIDADKLKRSVYSPAPQSKRTQRRGPSDPAFDPYDGKAGSPVLRRQEVREAFGGDLKALNDAIFRQAEASPVEPPELNPDVELLIDTLSGRLEEDSSRAYLREFADTARDPLREDGGQTEDP